MWSHAKTYTAQGKEWVVLHLSRKTKVALAARTGPMIEHEKPVHFEFYSALPDASVSMPLPPTDGPKERETVARQKQSVLQPFASAQDELEKELSHRLEEA
jgi:hypothetical protein